MAKKNQKTFAQHLRAYMAEHELTDRDIEDRTGIGKSTVCRWRTGSRALPTLDNLRKLRDGLGVDVMEWV